VSGRRVTSKAPFGPTWKEGQAGSAEASPTAILQDTHSVEEEFLELQLTLIVRGSVFDDV
jgi:hypothetical protein